MTTAGSARRPNTIKMPAPPDTGQNTAKVQGRRVQCEPKASCQKICNGDGARRAECRYPPARSGCLSYQIPVNPMGCACRLQSSPENVLLEVFFSGRVLYQLRSLPGSAVCANSINSAAMSVSVYFSRRQSGVSATAIHQRGNGNRLRTVLDRKIRSRRLCRRSTSLRDRCV